MDPEFLDTEGEHEHDDSVTSMSITTSGEVHMLLVNDWVGDVLKNLGNDIYRMKGVLAVAGSPKKFVYQAVHMIFDGVFEGEWAPSEERGNKLVFIGKNLDKAALQRGFEACLDTPQNRAKIEEAEMIKVRASASRRVGVPSLHCHESSPRVMEVGGFFFDFEAVRTEARDRDAPRRCLKGSRTRCSGRRSGMMWSRSRTSCSLELLFPTLIRWVRPRYTSLRCGATLPPLRRWCRPGRRSIK